MNPIPAIRFPEARSKKVALERLRMGGERRPGDLSCWILLAVGWAWSLGLEAQVSLFDPTFRAAPGPDGAVHGIAVQSDGRILLGGDFTTVAGATGPFLARLEANGLPDPSFGDATDGPVLRLLKQPDGGVLVAGGFTKLGGEARQSIGRLLADGRVDPDFDTGTGIPTNGVAYALACDAGERILVSSATYAEGGRLFRLWPDGRPDGDFIHTNRFDGLIHAVWPRPDGRVLVGGAFLGVNGAPCHGLALLEANGQLTPDYVSPLASLSTVFALEAQADGRVLVGGLLQRPGTEKPVVLGRLLPNLEWDSGYAPATFADSGNVWVTCLLRQPDESVLVAGRFHEVGGYWRRQIVRLTANGGVDPCFDPGLGLGNPGDSDTVHALALQPDGRVLAGGSFVTFEDRITSTNLVRFRPSNDCDQTRLHLGPLKDGASFVAATCAPGGSNLLQASTNLTDWTTVESGLGPYLYRSFRVGAEPGVFFRVKKEP